MPGSGRMWPGGRYVFPKRMSVVDIGPPGCLTRTLAPRYASEVHVRLGWVRAVMALDDEEPVRHALEECGYEVAR